MKPIQKLVAGVAVMNEMDPIIPPAAALAERSGLPLELVHAFDISDPFVDSYLRFSPLPGDHLEHYCEGLQARLEGQVGGLPGKNTNVTCTSVPATGPNALKEAGGEGALLLVGPTRRPRVSATFLGTTTQRVLREAASPVLVLRGDLAVPPRVLFCIDLAWSGARTMVEKGIAVIDALSSGSRVEARFLVVVRLEVELPLAGMFEELESAANEGLDGFLQGLPGHLDVSRAVRIGSPAAEAVAEAQEWGAELMVVGTHARTGVSRALLGSVAEAVVRDAPCGVLVVPPNAVMAADPA